MREPLSQKYDDTLLLLSNLFDQAIIDYKEKLKNSNLSKNMTSEMQLHLIGLKEKFQNKSTFLINEHYPDTESSPLIVNGIDYTKTVEEEKINLILYASRRNREFDKIENDFIEKLSKE